MKRIKLNKKEKECVKEWLETGQFSHCPFLQIKKTFCFLGTKSEIFRVCKSWFPEADTCPCEYYGLPYVTRKAKEMIK